MRKIALILGMAAVALILGGFGSWHVYQRHLSSELKRTLKAASDPNATEADIHSYLRSARLQMRTQKDREVDAEFETAVRLAEYSSETSSRVLNEQFESTGPRSDSTVEIGRLLDQRISYLQAHRPVPKELQDRIDSLLDDSKRENEFWREESKSAEEAAAQAKKLFVEVRAELGMPPLKS